MGRIFRRASIFLGLPSLLSLKTSNSCRFQVEASYPSYLKTLPPDSLSLKSKETIITFEVIKRMIFAFSKITSVFTKITSVFKFHLRLQTDTSPELHPKKIAHHSQS